VLWPQTAVSKVFGVLLPLCLNAASKPCCFSSADLQTSIRHTTVIEMLECRLPVMASAPQQHPRTSHDWQQLQPD
jgi:hypothetical protein